MRSLVRRVVRSAGKDLTDDLAHWTAEVSAGVFVAWSNADCWS